MFSGVVRLEKGGYASTNTAAIVNDGLTVLASDPAVNHGSSMVCYCSCPVPYDNTHSTWVAVFTTPIDVADEPLHADDLAFPLMLPLYPSKDLLIVAFSCITLSTPRAVYLSWPPLEVVKICNPLILTKELWKAALPAWKEAVRSLTMASWLSYAFDSAWQRTEKETLEDDDGIVLLEPAVQLQPVEANARPLRVQILSTLKKPAAEMHAAETKCDSPSSSSSCEDEDYSDVDIAPSPPPLLQNSSEDDYDFDNGSEDSDGDGSDDEDEVDLRD